MNRASAALEIAARHENALIVFSNGLTSREAAHSLGLGRFLYLLHAMGEAFSVATEFARLLPDTHVVLVEGDANAVMGSASWCEPPANFTHYILINGLHETTGGQELQNRRSVPAWATSVDIDEAQGLTPNPPDPSSIVGAVTSWIAQRGR